MNSFRCSCMFIDQIIVLNVDSCTEADTNYITSLGFKAQDHENKATGWSFHCE
jgi:hypothetical protein